MAFLLSKNWHVIYFQIKYSFKKSSFNLDGTNLILHHGFGDASLF
jgi:hypothetical protein